MNTSPKKLLFIFNPNSGSLQIKKHIIQIIDIFTKGGYDVTVYPTQKAKDCIEKIKSCGNDYDMIVTCGGDGTLNESINGLMALEKKVKFGYIPSGTTNDCAFNLKISSDMIEAANEIMRSEEACYDVGSLNGKYFVYVAAFGAFTAVTYETPQSSKASLGHAAYLLEGVKRFSSIKPIKLRCEHDGEVIEGDFLVGFVANTLSVGGYRKLNKLGVDLSDGLFEVVLIKYLDHLYNYQKTISAVLKQDFSSPNICYFKASNIKITALDGEINWNLDGENGGDFKEVEIINHKQKFRIMNMPYSFEITEEAK